MLLYATICIVFPPNIKALYPVMEYEKMKEIKVCSTQNIFSLSYSAYSLMYGNIRYLLLKETGGTTTVDR